MGKYFAHWIKMGALLGENAPKIFNVNWFRTDNNGKFLWPGYGDNLRVIEWIINRCEGKIGAKKTPVGYIPNEKDINLENSGITENTLKDLLTIDKNLWEKEVENIKTFYNMFGEDLPEELKTELKLLETRLKD